MLYLVDDSIYQILSFCDVFSLIKLLSVNKILNKKICSDFQRLHANKLH